MNLYSKIDGTLLHAYVRVNHITEQRQDISPPEEFLQVSSFIINEGKTYRPHKHIPCEKQVTMTQESWVIVRGSVQVTYYDIDDTVLEVVNLYAGDITITYYGGHNYMARENDTIIYEFKTGPYNGQQADKVFI